jgi:membrane protease YdiL (CAAX protease family)
MLNLSFFPHELLAEVLLGLCMVVVPLTVLKWWSKAGFTRGIDGQGVVICLLPVVLFLIPPLCSISLLVSESTPGIVVMAVSLTLVVALTEEGFFRGVLISALRPKGIWTAVLISSLIFTCAHLTNLISGFPPVYVIGQLVLTFGSGILFATLLVRTRSIWPSVLLHFLRDIAGLILLGANPSQVFSSNLTAAIVVNGIFSLLCVIIAVVLLRPSQVQKLRVFYGLAPAPFAPPVYAYPTYPGQPPYLNYPYPQPPVTDYPGQQPPTTPYPNPQPPMSNYPGQQPPATPYPNPQPPLVVYPDQQTPPANPPGYPEQ